MKYLSQYITGQINYWLSLLIAICIGCLILCSNGCGKVDDINTKIFYLNEDDQLCYFANRNDKGCLDYQLEYSKFQFSPDGKFICCLSPTGQLQLIDTKNYGMKTLTQGKTIPENPTPQYKSTGISYGSKNEFEWSPDSSQIIYSVYEVDTNGDGTIGWGDELSIRVVDIDGQRNREIVRADAHISEPIYWSNNGEHIFYTRQFVTAQNQLRRQYVRVNLTTGQQIRGKAMSFMRGDSPDHMLEVRQDLHHNRNNNPRWDQTKPSDTLDSTGRTVSMRNGNIFLDDEELVHFKWQELKFNPGYYNPRWLNERYIIYSGPSANLPILLSILFPTGHSIYLYDLQQKKAQRLLQGYSPGWWSDYNPDNQAS